MYIIGELMKKLMSNIICFGVMIIASYLLVVNILRIFYLIQSKVYDFNNLLFIFIIYLGVVLYNTLSNRKEDFQNVEVS